MEKKKRNNKMVIEARKGEKTETNGILVLFITHLPTVQENITSCLGLTKPTDHYI
jgi:hypothetical protein